MKSGNRGVFACVALVTGLLVASCGGKYGNIVFDAQTKIFSALQGQGVYERDNLPEDNPPTPDRIKGWFDIVGGTYRHIVNEDRDNRTDPQYKIERGDSIAFFFDAKIFSGSQFESMTTFYTNIEARIQRIAGNNPQFDPSFWPTVPLRIKVGEDTRILKSLHEALVGCMAGDGDPDNDEEPDGIASDQVRVYLTPDIAFGDKIVYNVPANSTLVFEITDIVIIR
jgi:hypothetical protein